MKRSKNKAQQEVAKEKRRSGGNKASKATRRHRQRVKGAKKAKENRHKNKVNRDKQIELNRKKPMILALVPKTKKKNTLPGLPQGEPLKQAA